MRSQSDLVLDEADQEDQLGQVDIKMQISRDRGEAERKCHRVDFFKKNKIKNNIKRDVENLNVEAKACLTEAK